MKKIIFFIIPVLVLANLAAFFLLRQPPMPVDDELTKPILANQAMQAKHPFTIEHSADYLDAARNPEAWRKLDRQEHFDAVILTGDPSVYQPLLEHLLHVQDWNLTYLDHTSFGFKRAPVAGWDIASLKDLEKRFADKPTAERVDFLVHLAGKLVYVDEVATARQLLEEAVKLDPNSAAAWSQLATFHAQSSLWGPALEDAEKALKAKPDYLPALEVKAQVLLAMNRTDEALETSRQVVKADPKNPENLFKYASIAHEAHDYQSEVAALRSLVDSAVEAKKPVAGYRIYLGQAYSRNGQRVEALEQFQEAVNSGELSGEQLDYAKEAINRLGGANDSSATPSPTP